MRNSWPPGEPVNNELPAEVFPLGAASSSSVNPPGEFDPPVLSSRPWFLALGLRLGSTPRGAGWRYPRTPCPPPAGLSLRPGLGLGFLRPRVFAACLHPQHSFWGNFLRFLQLQGSQSSFHPTFLVFCHQSCGLMERNISPWRLDRS